MKPSYVSLSITENKPAEMLGHRCPIVGKGLRGMLITRRVGQIYPRLKFQPAAKFFGDTRAFHLELKIEKIHPRVKWMLCFPDYS